ncbi:Flp pilus assembly protein CpaB [Lapillicoccus jejuensis]|uniref:Pilus assembly protein CpaB n=1 Tax=Lapillicoccus jejuensis TaxID=402171 RepID=A0A542E2I6_9MICO|nr:RcpC/CpaB family pilus assembly protein [Lapillicoccus jejuensis]TQJ09547.1 pilus assembly protein CpaB [Lapillicoccus jejuensis]
MKARVLALVVAALLAICGVGAVVLYAQGAAQRALAESQPVAVYVTDKLVPAGTTLGDAVSKGLLQRTSVPRTSAPAGALAEVSTTNRALVAVNDIQPGEFVLSARFTTTAVGEQAISVPQGQVAVAAQLSDPAKVGSFVRPGSRIVVFDTYAAPATTGGAGANPTQGTSTGGGQSTKVLLPDALVIAVGSTSLTPAEDGAAAPSSGADTVLVTLALSPDDAARLVHAIQTGKLYAGLRGTNVDIPASTVVSDGSLFSK